MTRYDPAVAPEAGEWLALDELSRIELVEAHHRAAGVELPNTRVHASIHCIVENQIAQGVKSVLDAMSRLGGEGLSRHDAVHAIGSVLTDLIYNAAKRSKDANPFAFSQEQYDAKLKRLTVKGWHRKYGPR